MNLMIRPFLGAALAAALLTPATAIAAPHWSSPVKIAGPAADPPGIATPKAFVTSDGRSLAVFSDGLRASLSAGTVAGTFAAPTPARQRHLRQRAASTPRSAPTARSPSPGPPAEPHTSPSAPPASAARRPTFPARTSATSPSRSPRTAP